MTDRKTLNAGRRIAGNSFDDGFSDLRELAGIFWRCNRSSEEQDLGVTFAMTANGFTMLERRPGDIQRAAETGQGLPGILLRWMKSEGLLSSRQVVDAIAYRWRAKENSEIRQSIRAKRNTKAVREQRAMLKLAANQSAEIREIVERCNAIIDRDVRATLDCRDVATDWPIRWDANLPRPVLPTRNPRTGKTSSM